MKGILRPIFICFFVFPLFLSKTTALPGYKGALGSGSSNGIGTQNTCGYSIARDPQGDVYITDAFLGTINFNPASTADLMAANGQDIFFAKCNSSGAYQWTLSIGSSNEGRHRRSRWLT